MEGAYRSPQHWDVLPVTRAAALDVQSAMSMEHAVCALPMWAHSLLRFWHVEKWRPEKICRVVKSVSGRSIRFGVFDESLLEAKRLLLHELGLPAVVRKERALARVLAIKRQLAVDTR